MRCVWLCVFSFRCCVQARSGEPRSPLRRAARGCRETGVRFTGEGQRLGVPDQRAGAQPDGEDMERGT